MVPERNGRWYIEIYDPDTRKKRQLNQAEIRALGFDAPSSERQPSGSSELRWRHAIDVVPERVTKRVARSPRDGPTIIGAGIAASSEATRPSSTTANASSSSAKNTTAGRYGR